MSSSAITPSTNLANFATASQAGIVSTTAQTFGGAKTFQDGIIFDPSTLTDAQATKLGLKQYLCDKASGANDIAYNGGNKATLTANDNVALAIATVTRGVLIPYQTQDAAWRLKFNIRITAASATRTTCSIFINGVTVKNSFDQAIIAFQNDSGSVGSVFSMAYGSSNPARLQSVHASVNTTIYFYSGDIELNSKPTWAY